MKTYLYIAVAALTLAACSNDENESRDNWNGEIRLSTANIAVPASRSISQDLQLTQFEEDAWVDVFINEDVSEGVASTVYAQPLICTTDGKGGLAFPAPQYFPQSGNGVNIIAIYPIGVADMGLERNYNFTIQADQSTDDKYTDSDLMYGVPASGNPVARTKEPINLQFTHKLSKIDINLIVGAGTPTLVDATVKLKDLIPTIGIIFKTGELTEAQGKKKDVIAADKNIDKTLKCSAIIIPQTVEQGSPFIEVTLPQGGVLTYKLENTTTFESGMKYTYNITVNLTGLTATSTIEDWTSAGDANNGTAEME